MGLERKVELPVERGLHPAGGLAHLKKKQKKKEKKSTVHCNHVAYDKVLTVNKEEEENQKMSTRLPHNESLQTSLLQSRDINSRFLDASRSSRKKKGRREKCENGDSKGDANGLEDVIDANMVLKKKRNIEMKGFQALDNEGSPRKKKSRNNEEQNIRKDKKKGTQLGSLEPLVEEIHVHGSNNRVLEDNPKLQVTVSGKDAHDEKFRPLQSFSEIQVPTEVLECCNKFEKPSPIQAHAWPFLLDGRDLIGIAATGSGKTLAFGLPALVHVLNKSGMAVKRRYASCLVLSPTRELAQQISEVLVDAGRLCGVRTACFYGGTSKKPQYASLKTGVDIIVATPGRIQDLVEEGHCSLQKVSFVVLDEADRMLDLGFEEAVRALVNETLKCRQTIMFSATWPSAVHQLAKEFIVENPIKVIVGSHELTANHAVSQVVEVINPDARDTRLIELLKEYHKSERNRILVFVLYKKEAVRVENMLQRRGWNVSAVHGDKGQFDRNKAVMSFKDGTCPLLIATDVAARGLDIPDVEYVINYSFPLTTEDYVHRIGRTGRAGKRGIAHTFFTHADKARAGELVNVLKEAGQAVPLELLKFGTSVKKKESKLYGAHFRDVAVDAPKATKITFDSSDDD